MSAYEFQKGDLLATTIELLARNDGLTFDESDCNEEGRIRVDWLRRGDILAKGTLCSYVGPNPDDRKYAVVRRDILGRVLTIKREYLSLVNSMDDTVDDYEE